MKQLLTIAAAAALCLTTIGCHNWHRSNAPATTTTETTFTPNRSHLVKERADEMIAKGIPADVAFRRAEAQVPIMTTTQTQTGDVQKQKEAQEKFEKDLAKANSGK